MTHKQGMRHAVRERAVATLSTAAGTAADPKAGARRMRSKLRPASPVLVGTAFAAGFLAGRRSRRT